MRSMCIKHPLGWFRCYMQRELVTSTGSLFHFSCMAFSKVFPSRGLPKYVKHHVTNSPKLPHLIILFTTTGPCRMIDLQAFCLYTPSMHENLHILLLQSPLSGWYYILSHLSADHPHATVISHSPVSSSYLNTP